jgi:REP element-mobilizing transposase RayT
MPESTFNQYAQFFKATILESKPLLAEDALKDIIISSLQFVIKDGRIKLYGFVMMPDHIHLVWQIQDKYERAKVQQSLQKLTTYILILLNLIGNFVSSGSV